MYSSILIIMIASFSSILVMILCFTDTAVLLRLPRLSLAIEAELTDEKYIEYIVAKNTGGRSLNNVSVKVCLKICVKRNDGPAMADLTQDIMIHDIIPGEKKRIRAVESYRYEQNDGGCVISLDGRDYEIEWERNHYSGNIICSSEDVTVERKIVIERTLGYVRTHLFRF